MKYWHIRGNKDDLRCSLVSMLILYETRFNPLWIVPVRVTKLPTTFFMFTKVPSTYLDQWLALSINFPRDLILRHLLPDYTCIERLVAENDWKQQREATNSGCPSYIGFKKCAPVDSARILVSGDTHNKKWMQPTQGTIFGTTIHNRAICSSSEVAAM